MPPSINFIKHRIAELRKLEAEATPAPWKGDEFEIIAPKAPTIIDGNVRLVLADDYHLNEWDADFVIKFRNAASPLLTALEEAIDVLDDCADNNLFARRALDSIARTLEAK